MQLYTGLDLDTSKPFLQTFQRNKDGKPEIQTLTSLAEAQCLLPNASELYVGYSLVNPEEFLHFVRGWFPESVAPAPRQLTAQELEDDEARLRPL